MGIFSFPGEEKAKVREERDDERCGRTASKHRRSAERRGGIRCFNSISSPAISSPTQNPELTKLFQENYEQLNEALAGTDHSWAGLTLKLCGSLETANKLVQTTNSNVTLLSEKVGDLERVIKRADSAIAAARIVHASLNEKEGSLIGNQNVN